MNPTPHLKNIVYGTITAGGDVHIGDNYYTVETAFKHSILFLRIDNTEGGLYALNLSIKSKHGTQGTLSSSGENLLHQAVSVNIPSQLFDDLAEFQTFRRNIDSQTRYKGVARHDTHSVQQLETRLSQQLFQTFFSGDIGQVCADFIQLLEERRIEELLLAISTEDSNIINLPFEMVLPLLFSAKLGETKKSLATSAFGLVRTKTTALDMFNMQGNHATAAPLKMLFITALPENLDESGKMLQIEEEQTRLIQAIGALEATGDALPKIVIEFLDNASLEELSKVLKARQHDIVHISGHGAYHQVENKGVLYFENEDGDAIQVTGAQLGETLRQHACVKLLILSACETAIAGSEGGVTEQAAAFGVPSIVAMRFAVTDEGAKVFTTELYTHLAKGASLTHALSYARETLNQKIERERAQTPHLLHIAEWFTPVVYHNQYVGSLISKTEAYHLPDNFYPLSSFLKTTQSRLIGEGFIGRKRYLIRMRQAFQASEHICLHGLGGLGKTTLAEAFAHHYASHESGEVIVFRNGSQINEKFILDELMARFEGNSTDKNRVRQLKAIVDNPQTDVLDKLQTVINNYLNRRKTILIFDNVEDVQVGEGGEFQRHIASEGLSAFLRHLCDNTPKNCHILFTTRYKIENLADVVEHIALDKMGYAEQYRLLNYSPILRGIPLADRDGVYKRLDGHPRGYEYLEALLKKDRSFTWQQVADSEAKVFENLLLAKVYDRLTDKEKAIFQIMSVFITRTPFAALAAVSGENEADLLPVLQSLQDWSLCFLEKDGRFEVHRLTREWMKENVVSVVKVKEWALKAGEYFLSLRNDVAQVHISSLQPAREYFKIAEHWEKFIIVTFSLERYASKSGYFKYAVSLNESILPYADESTKLVAQSNIGQLYAGVGDYTTSLAIMKQNLVKSRELNDTQNEAVILSNMGSVYEYQGKIKDAEDVLLLSLEICRKYKYSIDEAHTLSNLSGIYRFYGRYDLVIKCLNEALVLSQNFDDKESVSGILNNLGIEYERQEKYDDALNHYKQSSILKIQNGDKIGFSIVSGNIGSIYASIGKYDLALQHYVESLKIQDEVSDFRSKAVTLCSIGEIYIKQKQYLKAKLCLEEGEVILSNIGDLVSLSAVYNNLSSTWDYLGDRNKAFDYLNKSLINAQTLNDPLGLGIIYCNMGSFLRKYKMIKESIPYYLESRSILDSIKSPQVRAPLLCLLDLAHSVEEKDYGEYSDLLKKIKEMASKMV